MLGAGGQQTVCQRTAGRREALGIGAAEGHLAEAKGRTRRSTLPCDIFFKFTSCCSLWSPASCPSLCHWTSCGSSALTHARVPLSPSRPRSPSHRSRSRWRPRPCRPSWAPSGLQTNTRIWTLCWGRSRPQICSPAAGWRLQHHADRHHHCSSQSSTALSWPPGSHSGPQPLPLAHGCCC